MNAESSGFTLRPVEPGDDLFLFTVFALAYENNHDLQLWNADAQRAFLYQQYLDWETSLHTTYPTAVHYVIEFNRAWAGRLTVWRTDFEIRVVDITLLPEYQGTDLGETVMIDVLTHSDRMCLPVRLHAESNHPLKQWADHLGFSELEKHGSYWFMERQYRENRDRPYAATSIPRV